MSERLNTLINFIAFEVNSQVKYPVILRDSNQLLLNNSAQCLTWTEVQGTPQILISMKIFHIKYGVIISKHTSIIFGSKYRMISYFHGDEL